MDFLGHVEGWLPTEAGTVYAVLDNLAAHRAADVLLFSLAHPRWEFVFQPVYAPYLSLIEPWWKALRSLALRGRRFETWDEIAQAAPPPQAQGGPSSPADGGVNFAGLTDAPLRCPMTVLAALLLRRSRGQRSGH